MATNTIEQSPNKKGRFFGVVLLAFLAFSTINGSYFTVEQGQVGIKLRFGAMVGVEQPGVGFKIPFVEKIRLMSVRTEKVTLQTVESYSKDIQAAKLKVSLNYRIDARKAGDVYTNLGLNYVESVIAPQAIRITKEVFGQFNAQNIIMERATLGKLIYDNLSTTLSPHGLILESYQMEDVSFSEAFDNSIEARMQAEVEVSKLRQNLDREKVSADIARTKAAGAADALRSQAQAEADAIRIKGLAEAAAIQARAEALKNNPDMIKLIQAEKWNGVLPQTMVPNGTLPMLEVR